MRTLDRKGAKESQQEFEPHMTQEQLDQMKAKLKHLKEVSRPRMIMKTREYAANGDFSENAEYQIAKGKLRGINRGITELEYQIPRAIVIEQPVQSNTVQIGHTVTVSSAGKEFTWKILGPKESDPLQNIISHKSPIGSALLGKYVGDTISIELATGTTEYVVTAIESL